MLKNTLLSLCYIMLMMSCSSSAQTSLTDVQNIIKTKGTLVFEDNFDRTETDDSKEEVGDGWRTNSKGRAQGRKQADLDNSVLEIVRLEGSNHQTSVRRDIFLQNLVAEVKFRIYEPKGIAFNYSDLNKETKKVTSAGHICQVVVHPDNVVLKDQKMGQFNMDILKKRKSGKYPKEEIQELMKGTQLVVERQTSINEWHTMTIYIHNDILSAWIDGEKIGDLQSEGIGHPVKQNMAFSVPLKAAVDDLKIWEVKL